jgi:hypothetical protein
MVSLISFLVLFMAAFTLAAPVLEPQTPSIIFKRAPIPAYVICGSTLISYIRIELH